MRGITDRARMHERTSIVSFTMDFATPDEAAEHLGRDGIQVWSGDFYAPNAIEALGLSLPNSSAQAAVSSDKRDDCARAGAAVVHLVDRNIRPRDILTRKAFENAIVTITALGGSTNAVLHLLAIAHAAGVKLTLDDFTRIGRRSPVIADLKPSGKYVMAELIAVGGLLPLMKRLLDRGLLHGDAMTVTGRTLADNLRDVKDYPAGQTIVTTCEQPIKKDSHLVILGGNLAPDGAVAKISGKEGQAFTGKARTFDREEDALAAILAGKIKKGDILYDMGSGDVRIVIEAAKKYGYQIVAGTPERTLPLQLAPAVPSGVLAQFRLSRATSTLV